MRKWKGSEPPSDENKIQSVDKTLVIRNSTHTTQNGDRIAVCSIETPDRFCFGVTLTVISEKKAKLLIEADEDFRTDFMALFAHFISKLTNCNLQPDEIYAACKKSCLSDHYRFNKHARLFRDDYRSTNYYEERLAPDVNS